MTLYGLTLWRPWTDAIVLWPGRHAKRVENRTWWRASIVGRHIAIHAGQRYDREAAAWIDDLAVDAAESNGGWRVPGPKESPEGIVGVARVCGIVDEGDLCEPVVIAGEYPASGFVWNEWWMGGVGWLLDDVTAIEPIACKGAQGLWRVPDDVTAEVRRRWSAARSTRGSTRGSAPAPTTPATETPGKQERANGFEPSTFSLGSMLPAIGATETPGKPGPSDASDAGKGDGK